MTNPTPLFPPEHQAAIQRAVQEGLEICRNQPMTEPELTNPTPLSPAAQAVLSAAETAHDEWDLRPGLAAALRALAHHQSPAWDGTGPACHWTPTPHTRRELLNLANEIHPPVT